MNLADKMHIIAHIETEFPSKFGIPRQSGLCGSTGRIVFTPEYRNPDAFRGIEAYSHLWILWKFSKSVREGWNPTVRPPRLGGNQRVGVFATRSPFRPNPIGLSCVQMKKFCVEEEGPVLYVNGADMMSGTPIYDIKPYLPYVDSIPDAKGGFADAVKDYCLKVECPDELAEKIPRQERKNLRDILSQDPRPSYQNDPERIYGMEYAGMEVKFRIRDNKVIICEIIRK